MYRFWQLIVCGRNLTKENAIGLPGREIGNIVRLAEEKTGNIQNILAVPGKSV
jgi:hypothetical protein